MAGSGRWPRRVSDLHPIRHRNHGVGGIGTQEENLEFEGPGTRGDAGCLVRSGCCILRPNQFPSHPGQGCRCTSPPIRVVWARRSGRPWVRRFHRELLRQFLRLGRCHRRNSRQCRRYCNCLVRREEKFQGSVGPGYFYRSGRHHVDSRDISCTVDAYSPRAKPALHLGRGNSSGRNRRLHPLEGRQ